MLNMYLPSIITENYNLNIEVVYEVCYFYVIINPKTSNFMHKRPKTHNLLPRYCQFIVELSFIYNYKNSLITK